MMNKKKTAVFTFLYLSSLLFFCTAGIFAANQASRQLLFRYGYDGSSNLLGFYDYAVIFLCSAFFALILTLAFYIFWKRNEVWKKKRVADLAAYLRQMNAGKYTMRPAVKEDELSPLEDEIYKTVLLLREGRDAAYVEKEQLADNFSDIAHQLKTPLSSIALMSDLLAGVIEGRQAEYTERITAQVERLNMLVSSLLALSRLDAGTLMLDKKTVDVREMLVSAAEPLLPLMEMKSQKLSLPEHDAEYLGDFYWSGQAFSNLVKNCCEHTTEGGLISVWWEENPVCTVIVIEDNGEGIPAEDLPHLFDRFYRGKNAGKDSAGIGLSLAKAMIENQNGEIRAENRRKGGARFTVKFYRGA